MEEPAIVGGDDGVLFFAGRRSRRRRAIFAVFTFLFIHLVVFVYTMAVNDCPEKSAGDCVLGVFGRCSFQPLHENPLMGPSLSTLVNVGALQRSLAKHQQIWRLLTCPWLHAGLFHLIVNFLSIIIIGTHLEQDFGPSRTGIIYILSGLLGSLTSAVFVRHAPVVASSACLFGLLGATLAGLIQNWRLYVDQVKAISLLAFTATFNFFMGLLPYVDNLANAGGFVGGVLLGFTLLYNIKLSRVELEEGIFDYGPNYTVNLRQKIDKPAFRIIAFLVFMAILAGGLVAVFYRIDGNAYCGWCHYLDCVPTKMWSCNEKAVTCEAIVSDNRLILKCKGAEKFKTYPYANVSRERVRDLCSQQCS